MPSSKDLLRRRFSLRGPLSAFAALSSLLLLATCDLDKITAAKKDGTGTTLNFSIGGGTTVTLAGTTPLSITPAFPGTISRWASSAPAVARVDSLTGVVSGVSIGTATITARLLGMELDTGFVKSQDLRVRYADIRITAPASTDSISGISQTRSVSVFGTNALNAVQTVNLTSAATLSMHDSGATTQTVATLSGSTVTAAKNGTAYLKAIFDTDLSDSVKVRVRQVAKNITFSDTVYTSNALNFNRTIPVSVVDVANRAITTPTLRWRSSDTNKVAIDSMTGILRVKLRDTARVTVRMDTVSRSIKVRLIQVVGALQKDSGDAQVDTVGRTLPKVLKVIALDSGNAVVPGASVTFKVASGGGTITDSVQTTDANGAARLGSWTLGGTAGAQSVTASVGTITTTFTATARALGPAKLGFQVQPTSVSAGVAVAPAITVAIQDSLGNVVLTAQDSVFLAFSNNPTAGATLGGTLRVKAVNGIATFSDVTVSASGSAYTLQASSGTLTNAISNAFDVYGAATQLAFVVQPSNTTTGAVMTPAVRVAVQDATGNTVTNSTASITLAINNCVGCPAAGTGTLSGTVTASAVNGVATFSTLSMTGIANGYKLQATSTGLTTGVSAAFNITAVGTAKKLAFLQQPSNVVAGANISPAVTVVVQDSVGATVTTSSATINLTISTNPGNSSLSGLTQVSANAVNGVATFSTLSLNKTGTGYKLQAASTGLTSGISSAFNVTAGTASKLGFVQNPTHTVIGSAMSPAVTVAVQDVNGNLVTSAAATAVTLSLSGGGCTATPAGNTATSSSGIATFGAITFSTAFTNCAMVASATGLTAGTSTTFNSVAAGGAVKLGFISQPANATAGSGLGTIQVALQDANGATVTSAASTTVTLAIGTNVGNATLFGTVSVSTISGVATFSGQNIRVAGDGYTLTATATGYNTATSNTFNITAGVIDHLGFIAAPTSVDAGVTFPAIQVAVQDQYGNTVKTASNTVVLGLNNGGAPFNPWWEGSTNTNNSLSSAIAAVNGVATFSNLRLKLAQSGLKTYACSPSCNSPTYNTNPFYSDLFDVRLGPPSALTFTNTPGNQVTAGAAFSFDVIASDSVGNQITTMASPVTVSLTGGDATAVLSGTKTITAVDGKASFSAMSIDKSGSGYRMNASASGFTTTQSPAFSVTATSPVKLGWIDQPQNTFQNAPLNPSGQLPRIAIQDQFGNTSTQCCYTVKVRIGTAPGGVQLKSGGFAVTDVNYNPVDGIVTLPSDLVLTGSGNNITLIAEQAFSSTLTAATSTAFNLAAYSAKAKVGFVTPPQTNNGYAVNVSPAVQVAIQDTYGNTVDTATNQVSLALSDNPGAATLRGGGAIAAVAGLATFDTLSLDKVASGYRLQATSTGLTSASTDLFNVTTPGTVKDNIFSVNNMVLSGNQLYWIQNASSGTLSSISAFGGNENPMAVTSSAVKIAADATYVYWIESGDGTNGAVNRVKKSDETVLQLTTALNVPSFTGRGFAVDDAFVYYIARNDAGNGYAIRRVAIGSGTSVQLFDVGFFSNPYFLLDAATSRIFYYDPSLNAVRRMASDGTSKTTLAAGTSAFQFGLTGTTLYFADFSNNIRSISTETAGGTVTPYFTATQFVQDLSVDGTSLYVDVSGEVRRYPLSNITSTSGTLLTSNAHLNSAQLLFDAASMYFYNGGQIQKVVK